MMTSTHSAQPEPYSGPNRLKFLALTEDEATAACNAITIQAEMGLLAGIEESDAAMKRLRSIQRKLREALNPGESATA